MNTMPLIDAGSTGIRPIDRQRPTDGLDRVRRRDDGGGGFRPQTTVNLKTAIQDIAATLGKIGTEEKYGIQRLPKEVGDVVKNILQQSLSLEATLGKGIGSTVESQRFSMDQLMLFSRMLLQIGTLAERGYSMKLSEDTQILLSNFKDAIIAEEGGEELEPILMTKASFELVDAKTAEQLPQALYEILSQLANMPDAYQQQQPQSEPMQFLKQLVRYFMPRPEVDNFQQEQPLQQQPQPQQGQQPQGATQRFLESMFKTFGGKFAQPQGQAQFNPPNAQGQTQFTQPNAQGQAQFNPSQPQGQAQFNQPQPQGQAQFNPSQPQGQTQFNPSQPQFDPTIPRMRRSRIKPKHVSEDFVNRQEELRMQMEMAKNAMLKQNLQNTPQTNDTMKSLAQFLLRNPSATQTPRDAALLQNFINNSQQMMSEDEARHLQNLLRLCQNNIPLTVRQAAVQQNLPDLPRLWAFMQMCDMANVTSKMNARAFKRAGKEVADFTNAMRHAMSAENSVVQNQRSFQMMLPLYMGDNEASYPTYLNVYDENTKDEETGQEKKETWFRICVLTDYIGAAELVFRVYEETHLDMRFYFSRIDIAEEFRSTYLDSLRNSIKQTELNLGEVRVGGVGERMFSF